MPKLQIAIVVVTVVGAQLVILFPPWLEIRELPSGDTTAIPYCCFDHPLWRPPAVPGHSILLDRRRLARQLALVLGPGLLLLGLSAWAGRRVSDRQPD